jgi:hypothetical protein
LEGWKIGGLDGWLGGWMIGKLIGRWIGKLVNWKAGSLEGRLGCGTAGMQETPSALFPAFQQTDSPADLPTFQSSIHPTIHLDHQTSSGIGAET